MKYLFKNSFFSFFKNKIAIILMMVIIFLTSFSFTMFNASHHAFKQSYESVMHDGHVHQYTIKELYNIEGDVVFEDPQKDLTQKPKTKIDYQLNTTPDTKIDNKNPKIVSYEKEKYLSFPISIVDNYKVQHELVGFVSLKDYKLVNINNKKSFTMLLPMNKNISDLPNSLDETFEEQGYSVHKLKININSKEPTWTQKNWLEEEHNFMFKNYDNLFNNIKKAFSNNIKETKIPIQKYNISLNKNDSGKIFNDIAKAKYSFWLDEDKLKQDKQIDPKLDWSQYKVYDVDFNVLNKPKTISQFRDLIYKDLWASAQFKMHQNMIDFLKQKEDQIDFKDVKSFKVASQKNDYKIVKDSSSNIDKMRLYKGSQISTPLPYNDLVEKLKDNIQNSNISISKNNILNMANNPKDVIKNSYSVSVSNSGFLGATVVAKDPSSMEAIISPSYASEHNIKPISKSDFNKIINNPKIYKLWNAFNSDFAEFKNALLEKVRSEDVKSSLIFLGQTPYFIRGIGITPDFAFPMVSKDKPLPDVKREAIVYVNQAGYDRLNDANKTAPTENYISFSIKNNVNHKDREKLLSEIKTFANSSTSWPTGINAVSTYDDENEKFLLTPSRITFLENLNNNISNVSWIVTSLLVLFTAFIVIIVVRKQINNRKKQLGILLANGYSKNQIATSMMIVGAIVSIIPATFGYIFGHFMQFALMDIFANYWTLPIWKTQFSWVTLLVTFIIPLVTISLLAFIISLITMKGTIPEILNGVSIKTGTFTKYAMKPFGYLGIKTKMAGSIIFSNLGKLFIAFVAFLGTIIGLSVSFTSIGKFNQAMEKSEAGYSYEYKVDLTTPTIEGGLYSAQTLKNIFYATNLGDKVDYKNINDISQILTQTTKDHYENHIIFHIPTGKDGIWSGVMGSSQYYPYYLKNRIQIKSLLDTNVLGTTNPWNIAAQMMPENQRNQAESASAKFVDWTAREAIKQSVYDKTKFNKLLKDKIIIKNDKNEYILSRENNNEHDLTANLKKEYKDFIAFGIWNSLKSFIDNNNRNTPLPYFMSYNNIIIDNDDELYTHINTTYNGKNFKNKIENREIKIRGISLEKLKNKSSMIHLSQKSIKSLEANNLPKTLNERTPIPIVINKLFATYNKIKEGDSFKSTISNMSNRYQSDDNTKRTFKVVGIENTYDSDKIYTLQKYANQVIGLNEIQNKNPNPLVKNKNYFNGVMTKHQKPLIFKTMSLYSHSGLYLGKNNVTKRNTNLPEYKVINKSFFEKNHQYTFNNQKVKKINDLFNIYGDGQSMQPMNSVVNDVAWSNISRYQFRSISELSASLMNTIQTITIFITCAFVILIATMIISDNKKFISTLKVMGYRTREISKIFLATFIPSLLFAIACAIPSSILILNLVQNGIMGFGNILVPLKMVGWELISAIVILLIGFLVMYWFSARSLKNTSLIQAFNE